MMAWLGLALRAASGYTMCGGTMNNATYLKLLPRKKAYKSRLNKTQRRLSALKKERDKLSTLVYELSKVGLVYRGVAVEVTYTPNCYGPDSVILRRCDRKRDLSAYIYINAHNQKTFGLTVGSSKSNALGGDLVGSPDWATHRLAVKVGLDYLVTGKTPSAAEMERRTRERPNKAYLELPSDDFSEIPDMRKSSLVLGPGSPDLRQVLDEDQDEDPDDVDDLEEEP
jgi:hypothetical protein